MFEDTVSPLYLAFSYEDLNFYIKPYSKDSNVMYCGKNGTKVPIPVTVSVKDMNGTPQKPRHDAFILNYLTNYEVTIADKKFQLNRTYKVEELY